MGSQPSIAQAIRDRQADYVLTETGGPFLARGDQPIEPGDVARTVEMIASSLGSPIENVRSRILSNFKRLVQSN